MQRFVTSIGKNFSQFFLWILFFIGLFHSWWHFYKVLSAHVFLFLLFHIHSFYPHSIVKLYLFVVHQPATVSRCGMIYLEPASLGWDPVLQSWLNSLPELLREEHTKLLNALFHWALPACLTFVRKHCKVMKWAILKHARFYYSGLLLVLRVLFRVTLSYCT